MHSANLQTQANDQNLFAYYFVYKIYALVFRMRLIVHKEHTWQAHLGISAFLFRDALMAFKYSAVSIYFKLLHF